MLIKISRKILAVLLVAIMTIGILLPFISENKVHAASTGSIINVNSSVNIRSMPSSKSDIVTTLALGSTVTILETVKADKSDVSGYSYWYKISFTVNGYYYEGYVATYYVKKNPDVTEPTDKNFEKTIKEFPESYKPYLRTLHKEHPNWTFTPVFTGTDWYDALNNESQLGHSLIEKTSNINRTWLSTASGAYDPATKTYKVFDSPNWVNASRGIIAYYLDPRNNLNGSGVFQFLNLSYEKGQSSEAEIEALLSTTFMSSSKGTAKAVDGSSKTYAKIFLEAGNKSHVHPVFLAAKSVQEVSPNGSTSSNGSRGLYNFYNIGAYSNVFNAALVGLSFAEKGNGNAEFNAKYLIPWNTQGKSIVGGALWISDHYVSSGQNTIYFMRFNFNPDSKYSIGNHQYMTAIQSATSESSKMYDAFVKAGSIDNALNFAIPVYENMPEASCPIPTAQNETERAVKTTYNLMFNREATDAEVTSCTNFLKSKSAVDMVEVLAFNKEFESLYPSDKDFITYAYKGLTGLDIQSSDLEKYQEKLDRGYTRHYVYALMANSYATMDHFNTFGMDSGVYEYDMKSEDDVFKREDFVVLLYSKFLGRKPDKEGLKTWTEALKGSFSGPQVAACFFNSSEYLSKNISNEEFINQLYSTCLGRKADPAGFETWVNMLDTGVSRDHVLAGFVNSNEFLDICEDYNVSTKFYTPEGPQYQLTPNKDKIGTFVTFLYNSTLNRDPDSEGFEYWTNQIMNNGMSGETAARGFIFSQEMNDKNLSNEDFVVVLYHAFLGRDPDPAGFDSWVQALTDGASRENIFGGFVYSEEFTSMCLKAGFKPYDSYSA